MPRRRVADRRAVLRDPVYNDPLVTKFINGIMWGGKKSKAEKTFYDALRQVGDKTGEEPLKVFKKAIENVRPNVEVKSRRVGGSTYQVPVEVHQAPPGPLSLPCLLPFPPGPADTPITDRLAAELLDAAYNCGNAVKKKDDTHRM